MIGFNGCLGYDYHPEDKTLSNNEEDIKKKKQTLKDISALEAKNE